MDAIKKKMVAMKMEKENALDRAEQLEQKLRETEEAKAKVNMILYPKPDLQTTRTVRVFNLLALKCGLNVFFLLFVSLVGFNHQWTAFCIANIRTI